EQSQHEMHGVQRAAGETTHHGAVDADVLQVVTRVLLDEPDRAVRPERAHALLDQRRDAAVVTVEQLERARLDPVIDVDPERGVLDERLAPLLEAVGEPGHGPPRRDRRATRPRSAGGRSTRADRPGRARAADRTRCARDSARSSRRSSRRGPPERRGARAPRPGRAPATRWRARPSRSLSPARARPRPAAPAAGPPATAAGA